MMSNRDSKIFGAYIIPKIKAHTLRIYLSRPDYDLILTHNCIPLIWDNRAPKALIYTGGRTSIIILAAVGCGLSVVTYSPELGQPEDSLKISLVNLSDEIIIDRILRFIIKLHQAAFERSL